MGTGSDVLSAFLQALSSQLRMKIENKYLISIDLNDEEIKSHSAKLLEIVKEHYMMQ